MYHHRGSVFWKSQAFGPFIELLYILFQHGDNAQDFFNRPQDNPEEGGYPGELIKYLQNFVDILKADELLGTF